MRSLLPWLLLAGGLAVSGSARADGLTADELARLERRETIVREHTVERGDHRYVGGITYTIMDAGAAEVAAVLENVDSLRRVLPKTKSARFVGASGGDDLVELVQGNAVVQAEYTLRVRREPGVSRFWLEPGRPHGIDDAWGFFRYQPFIGAHGEARVLLTYGVLVDVGPGLMRGLFEDRIRAALLSVPQLMRRQVAERSRPF
jgi:hypothetical protein